MSIAATIAAAASLETKRKLFELNHGEWVTCHDAVDAKIISRSSAGINFKQLVDVGFMECDSRGNAHKYRAIAPIDTKLRLEMFVDEGSAKKYYEYIAGKTVKPRPTYSHNGAKSNAYKSKLKIQALQRGMTSTPESVEDIAIRLNIHKTTTQKMLNILFSYGCCRKEYGELISGKKRRFVYYVTPDCKTYDPGDPVVYTPHADSRDGWKPSKMPTDDMIINTMLGYTQFKPPEGRRIHEAHSHGTRKTEYSLTGNCMRMMEMAA